MAARFQTVSATPPGGYYEYAVGEEVVHAKGRFDICRKAVELRRKHGLPVAGDGMSYVMEYMCPRLPDGFCTAPSSIKTVAVETVKAETAKLFPLMSAASDDIERRMARCMECPQHTRRGFCVTCNGLLDWVYRGYGPRRGHFPADVFLGACLADEVLAAAGATPSSRPLKPGAAYPETCWRTEGVSDAG